MDFETNYHTTYSSFVIELILPRFNADLKKFPLKKMTGKENSQVLI